MILRLILILIIGLYGTNISQAQQLNGVVLTSDNQPIEAAYIYNLNSKSHAHSSENGRFLLENSKVGDSLRIGLLGYKNQEIKLTEADFNSDFSIKLEENSFQLEEMILTEELNTLSSISRLDLKTNPVNSSQEILRKVPGLIIGQHAGGGKAEQIFLRGFDIDHGTDISISVDGMPVNMVSHAHGQGYSDLHFLIPETINKIDFGKGTYYANKGDFNTAGYVDFKTSDYLKQSTVSVSLGQFNNLRTLGMFNLLETTKRQNAYIAMEYIETDGPFESPQNFNRINLFGKYVLYTPANDKLSISASHFTSRWDASGQIPQRSVDDGSITRFGAIDDTEGGQTERSNLNIEFQSYLNDETSFKTSAFYSYYNFELFSNFTFFLEDPINGDQIRQKEDREIFGAQSTFKYDTSIGKTEVTISTGISLRHDRTKDSELSKTKNRNEILSYVQLGDINQTNFGGFLNSEFDFGDFKIAPALRLDYFKFNYIDKLQTNYTTLSETKLRASPKLNFFLDVQQNLQIYLKSGIGFHSNDTRVVVSNGAEDILPKAYGLDLGGVWKPSPKLILNSALWYLFLDQEFVYVGDAGIVEPSGKTRRYGLDFGLRYQILDWLYVNSDLTLTKARSVDDPEGQNYIPLAPDFTWAGGLSFTEFKGFSGSFNFRYIDDRPANEDNSIVAQGYFVSDFNANYTFNNWSLGIAIENVFDVAWNETQFATESRLRNEASSVEEIHFTPGTPFFARATVAYSW